MTQLDTTELSLINCNACQLPLEGNFARALDGAFHWDCFLCIVSLGVDLLLYPTDTFFLL